MTDPATRDIEAIIEAAGTTGGNVPHDRLRTYLSEILSWNTRIGLVSRRSTAVVLARLVRQSIEMWTHVNATYPAGTLADIGSGAGFPGVMCKLMSPDLELLLIERRQRKATFLERIATILEFTRTDVVGGEARAAAERADYAGHFDLATASAVADPEALADAAGRLLHAGGRFVAFRAQTDRSAPASHAPGLELENVFKSPACHLAIYRRTS